MLVAGVYAGAASAQGLLECNCSQGEIVLAVQKA
jgi:hypothetical protein